MQEQKARGHGLKNTRTRTHTLLGEGVRQKNAALTQRLESLAREQGAAWSDQCFGLVVQGLSAELKLVSTLFELILAQGVPMGFNFALALISFCGQAATVATADNLPDHLDD